MFESATAHATIAVSDLDRARKFYEETLGFKVKDDRSDGVTPRPPRSWTGWTVNWPACRSGPGHSGRCWTASWTVWWMRRSWLGWASGPCEVG